MGKKFSTTDARLFTNDNVSRLPDWMTDLKDNVESYIKNDSLNIDFEKRTAFSEGKTFEREAGISDFRKLEASFSDKKIELDSKIDLSKFLTGKHYKTITRVAGKNISLDTTIDGISAEFTFNYTFNNGKTNRSDTFMVNNEVEYPFSGAGFAECIDDIKKGRVTTAKKIQSSRNFYSINREEIIRRFNGSIREASDKIEAYVKEGMIVGVSSNTYSTFYNPDELFPRLEKEKPQNRLGSFEYVDNLEHVASHEVKSDKNLAIEASKILGNVFKDHNVKTANRDGSELLVKANVLSKTGKTYNVDFVFDIDNESVKSLKLAEYNDQRMSINELLKNIDGDSILNKLSSKNVASRIYNGSIISQRDLKTKLASIVTYDKINDFVDGLVELGALKQINSTTYASDKTIDDLVSLMKFERISDNDVDQIIKCSKKDSFEFERIDQRDFGNREVIEENNKEKSILASNAFLSSKFKNYTPKNVEYNNGKVKYSVELFDENTGLSNNVTFNLGLENNKVRTCTASINNKEYALNNVLASFSKNEVLSKYVQGSNTKVNAPMMITRENLYRKLSKVANLSNNALDTVINNWEKSGKINNIYDNMYASKYTLESLISMSNLKALSDEAINKNITASRRDKMMNVRQNFEKDNDTRIVEEEWSKEKKQLHAKAQIGSMFDNFNILKINDNNNGYNVFANVTNPVNGTKINLQFNFDTENNKRLGKIASISNGEKTVSKLNIMDILNVQNDAFYSIRTAGKQVGNSKNVFTLSSLSNSLASISSVPNKCIFELENKGLITRIANNKYASNSTMGELVDYLNANSLLDTKAVKNNRSKLIMNSYEVEKNDGKKYDFNSREIVASKEKLTPELINTRDNLLKLTEKSRTTKKITASKCESLKSMLTNASTSKDIENIWRELKKYL